MSLRGVHKMRRTREVFSHVSFLSKGRCRGVRPSIIPLLCYIIFGTAWWFCCCCVFIWHFLSPIVLTLAPLSVFNSVSVIALCVEATAQRGCLWVSVAELKQTTRGIRALIATQTRRRYLDNGDPPNQSILQRRSYGGRRVVPAVVAAGVIL